LRRDDRIKLLAVRCRLLGWTRSYRLLTCGKWVPEDVLARIERRLEHDQTKRRLPT
jgi:hypothetical protein